MSFATSNNAWYYITLWPNSTDDWETDGPFDGNNLYETEVAYYFGNTEGTSPYLYKSLSKLISIGNIDRNIDVFEGKSKLVEGVEQVNGVGGVAKSGSFTFSLENLSDDVDIFKIMGRTVKVVLGYGSTIKAIGSTEATVVFVGQIYDLEAGRDTLSISCRGRFNQWDKYIGTLVDDNNIKPVVYGDLTDDNAHIPLVADTKIKNSPSFHLDSETLNSFDGLYLQATDNLFCKLSNDYISEDNKKFRFEKDSSDVYAYTTIGQSDSTIKLVNARFVAVKISSGTPVEGDVYDDGSVRLIYWKSADSFHLFKCVTAPSTGNWTRVSGSGDSSISINYVSTLFDSPIPINHVAPEFYNYYSDAKPIPTVIRINDEKMKIYFSKTVVGFNMHYFYTEYVVERGYDGTTATAHAPNDPVYGGLDTETNTVKADFLLTLDDLSGFSMWRSSGITGETGDTYNDDRDTDITVSKTGDSSFIEDFQIGDPISNTIKFDFDWTMTGSSAGYAAADLDLIFPKLKITGLISGLFLVGYFKVDTDLSCRLSMKTNSIRTFGYFNTEEYLGFNRYYLREEIDEYVPDRLNYPMYAFQLGDLTYDEYQVEEREITGDPLLGCQRLLASTTAGSYIFNNVDDSPNRELKDYTMLGLWVFEDKDPYPRIYSVDGKIAESKGHSVSINNIRNLENLNERRIILELLMFGIDGNASNYCDLTLGHIGLKVHASVDPLENQIYAKAKGREAKITMFNRSVGDLLQFIPDVVEDLLRREAELSDLDLSEGTFDTVYNNRVLDSRAYCAFVKHGQPFKLFDLLNTLMRNHCLMLVEQYDSTVGLKDLQPFESGWTVDKTIADSDILVNNDQPVWSQEYTSIDRLITRLDARFKYNHATEKYGTVSTSIPVDGLVDASKYIQNRPITLAFETIRDATTLRHCAEIYAAYTTRPFRIIEVSCKVSVFDVSLGDWVNFSGSAVRGSTAKSYLVIGYSLNLGKYQVDLTLMEFDGDEVATAYQENVDTEIDGFQEYDDDTLSGFQEVDRWV